MKYDKLKLNILKSGGKRALLEFNKSNRIPLGRLPNRIIESKKYKQKYKGTFDEDTI